MRPWRSARSRAQDVSRDTAAAPEDVAVVVVLELEDSVPVVPVVVERSPEDTDVVVEEDVCETIVEGTGEMVLVLVLVVVLVLRLVVFDVVEPVGPDIRNEPKLSSEQIPEVQGSLAQHPRKFPAEQTYHCFEPSQVVLSR